MHVLCQFLLNNVVFWWFAGNTFCAGDHVSWHAALDGSESQIQHMLLTSDAQLQTISTPCGTVDFVQVGKY